MINPTKKPRTLGRGDSPLIKYLITNDKYKNKLIHSTENFNKEVQEASKLNHVDVIKYLIEESPIKNKINIRNVKSVCIYNNFIHFYL